MPSSSMMAMVERSVNEILGLSENCFRNSPPFEAILSNQITGIALDQAGNMVVTGYTLTPDFPTVDAVQPALTGSVDAFLTVISADGQKIDYSTYLGGANGAQAAAVTVDLQGNPIVAGYTSSTSILGTAILQDTTVHPPPSGFVANFTVTAPPPRSEQ